MGNTEIDAGQHDGNRYEKILFITSSGMFVVNGGSYKTLEEAIHARDTGDTSACVYATSAQNSPRRASRGRRDAERASLTDTHSNHDSNVRFFGSHLIESRG